MQLIRIAYGVTDILDRQLSSTQKLDSFIHAVSDEEFLRTGSELVAEYFAQIIAVDFAGLGNIGDRDIVLEILVYKGKSPFQVVAAHTAAGRNCTRGGGTCQAVQKQVEMRHQIKYGFIRMLGHIEHGVFHLGGIVFIRRMVDWIIDRETRGHKRFFYMHTIEFYPGIFPGMLFVSSVSCHLAGHNQKALSAVDMVYMLSAIGIYGTKGSTARDDIVEQVMTADMRAERMQGLILSIAVLIHT